MAIIGPKRSLLWKSTNYLRLNHRLYRGHC